ncbi:hypothetical protein ACT3TB_12595 [Micrococcaceae sp. AOP34-BR2-30]|uniref:hypothetical protein n=1 Tax=Microbacteriaceae TaxID=85023 RepID=UPI00097F0B98|nr:MULTISPECIES: hypothetical protein [Microbacteriaceae]MDA3146025.1 hypothetical protein [Leucobacter sp. UCMA 4100]SJM68435.1 hypothetical protein FM112_13350 [Gulosibacter sp. 10]
MKKPWRYIWWAVIAAAVFAAGDELYAAVRFGAPIDWSLMRLAGIVIVAQCVIYAVKHPGKARKLSAKMAGLICRGVRVVFAGLSLLASKAHAAVTKRTADKEVLDELD